MTTRLGTLIVVASLAVGVVLALSDRGAPDPIAVGQRAPGFSLARVGSGEPVSLAALEGRIVLLNFWATWCAPCEAEMPAMERLYRALRGPDFELVAISVDDDPALVEKFRERLQLSFPIVMDPGRRAAESYQTYRFPETFLIDREGRVVARFVGPRDWDASAYVERIRTLIRNTAKAS